MEFKGFGELTRLYQELPMRLQDKVNKAAIRASANPTTRKMREMAPKRTGLLRGSIAVKVINYLRSGTAVAVIGAKSKKVQTGIGVFGKRKGKPIYANPAKYIHLAEGGHDGGKGATRFMERSFDATAPLALDRYRRYFQKGLEREATKLGAKIK